MEIITNSTQKTKELARELAKKIQPGVVIALYGDLGAGKTTFTSFLVKALGSDSRVQSPTFVVLRKYKCTGKIKNINHLDLYRLTEENDVLDLGFEELINEDNSITIIEWPKIAEKFLPKETLRIYFEYIDDNKRKIKISN